MRRCWEDLLNRIALTGLVEGTPQVINGVAYFIFVAEGAPVYHIPTIEISYRRVEGDLIVLAAYCWQGGDYEDQATNFDQPLRPLPLPHHQPPHADEVEQVQPHAGGPSRVAATLDGPCRHPSGNDIRRRVERSSGPGRSI